MEHKIIYYLPLEIYLMEKKLDDVKNILIKMFYSILTVNANLNNDIIVFTDFTGMSIFSILPLNFKIVHSDTVGNFYNKMIMELKNEKYVIMHENQILKMCTEYKGDYINNFKINDNAINNEIEIHDMIKDIKEISIIVYEKFFENIKKYVK
jgi:hypothetical protein